MSTNIKLKGANTTPPPYPTCHVSDFSPASKPCHHQQMQAGRPFRYKNNFLLYLYSEVHCCYKKLFFHKIFAIEIHEDPALRRYMDIDKIQDCHQRFQYHLILLKKILKQVEDIVGGYLHISKMTGCFVLHFAYRKRFPKR